MHEWVCIKKRGFWFTIECLQTMEMYWNRCKCSHEQ